MFTGIAIACYGERTGTRPEVDAVDIGARRDFGPWGPRAPTVRNTVRSRGKAVLHYVDRRRGQGCAQHGGD